MKPPPFEYYDPRTVDEVLSLLSEHRDDAKVLAGGQSLVPMLNFRLTRPERLVDINGVGELEYMRIDDGVLRIGALTRQSALEHSPVASAQIPLLREALKLVGHPQIRNRGTVGGSVVHADPAAELPVAFAALGSRFRAQSGRGTRELTAEQLFFGALMTSLEPDELLTEIEVPVPPTGTGCAFFEFSRREGDFALGGAAVLVTLEADETCRSTAICLLAAGPTPSRAHEAEEYLRGGPVDETRAAEAAERAVVAIEPFGDMHGGGAYRSRVICAMVRRALLEASARARAAA